MFEECEGNREAIMKKALDLVEKRVITKKELFDSGIIHKSSFYRALSAKSKGRDVCSVGRPPLLNKQNKSVVKESIKEEVIQDAYPCAKQVREMAQLTISESSGKPMDEILISRTWPYRFLNDQSDLFFIHPIQLPAARAAHSTKECLAPWFEKVKSLYNEFRFQPELIFNLDEVYLSVSDLRPVKVVNTEDARVPFVHEPVLPPSISSLFLISADGVRYPVVTKIKAKKLPIEFKKASEPQLRFVTDETCAMTKESFQMIFDRVIIPSIVHRRIIINEKNSHCFLFMDSLAAHLSPQIIQQSKVHHIDLCFPPSHTSHLVQPLDLNVNATFKNSLRTMNYETPDPSASEKRKSFLDKFINSLHAAFKPSTIKASFRDSGIWPFNPEIVLSKVPEKRPEWVKVSEKIMDPAKPFFFWKNVYIVSSN